MGHAPTRWQNAGHIRRGRVEDALALDVLDPVLKPAFASPSESTGTVRWTISDDETLSLSHRIHPIQHDPEGTYRQWDLAFDERPESLHAYRLEPTHVGFNLRWYVRCPRCLEFKRKLYFSPSELQPQLARFICRHCAGLTYRSVQTHDRRVSGLVRAQERGNFDAIDKAAEVFDSPSAYRRLALSFVWIKSCAKHDHRARRRWERRHGVRLNLHAPRPWM